MARKQVELLEIRKKIVEAITAKYKMTVGQFSESDYPSKLKIKGGNTLRCYLQGNGTSFDTLKILCNHFKLGNFEKETVVTKVTTYFFEGNTVEAKPQVRGAANSTVPPARTSKIAKKTAKAAPTPTKKVIKKGR